MGSQGLTSCYEEEKRVFIEKLPTDDLQYPKYQEIKELPERLQAGFDLVSFPAIMSRSKLPCFKH